LHCESSGSLRKTCRPWGHTGKTKGQ
jgi:hypothetical protein